ncbi:MAG: hypothetical protein WBF69_08495 [Castellaniella sp.]|uniref:TadE/TadG family type IV pilus assembly protein n=1 Tax=Castellaniella sp. TaxID=1955812 RepID=UPI003C762484
MRSQRGAGMAGFLAVLIPVLSLGMGGVELAHWMNLRQALSLALMDAARAGATRQARPQAIADAFEQGLRRILVRPAAQAQALHSRQQALGVPWRIHILQPAPAAFLDHADASLSSLRQPPGQTLIRNDYQARQHARRMGQGWPHGRGPQSGMTIFQANTLLMDLWWPQAPVLPGVSAIVRALAPLHTDPIGQRMMQSGHLPFRRRIRMAMQSHPAAWPDLPDGRVIHAASTGTSRPGHAQTESIPDGSQPPETHTGNPDGALPPDTPDSDTGPAPDGEPGAVHSGQGEAHRSADADGDALDNCAP